MPVAGQALSEVLAGRHGGEPQRWTAWLRQIGLQAHLAEAQLTLTQRGRLQQQLALQRPAFATSAPVATAPTHPATALQWARQALLRYTQTHQPWALADAAAATAVHRDHIARYMTAGEPVTSQPVPLPVADPLLAALQNAGAHGPGLRLWLLLEVAARDYLCRQTLAALAWTGLPGVWPLRVVLAIAAPGTIGRPMLPPQLQVTASAQGDVVRLRGPRPPPPPRSAQPAQLSAQVAGLLQRLPPLPTERIGLVLTPTAASAVRDVQLRWHYRDVVQRSGGSGGVIALFAGQPGHGRRTAARQLAAELGLDVCRVQAALLGSRWIGEAERRMSQMFAQAAAAGAALLIEEANDLLSRHVSATTANDRYANNIRNHLLQEIEQFPGLVLLIAAGQHQFDAAMRRRIHVTVRFEAPDRDHRAAIVAAAWQWLIARAPQLAPARMPDFVALVRQPRSPQDLVRAVIEAGMRCSHDRSVVDDEALLAVLPG